MWSSCIVTCVFMFTLSCGVPEHFSVLLSYIFLRCKPRGINVKGSAAELLLTVGLHIGDIFKGGTVVARQVIN